MFYVHLPNNPNSSGFFLFSIKEKKRRTRCQCYFRGVFVPLEKHPTLFSCYPLVTTEHHQPIHRLILLVSQGVFFIFGKTDNIKIRGC